METSGYILGRHLLQESLSGYIDKFSLFSVRAVLTNYLTVRCIIYHHSALHLLFNYILLSPSYNESALSTIQELWLGSWISNFKCPARAWTSFPQEPNARSPPEYQTLTITFGIQHQRGQKSWNGGGGRGLWGDVPHFQISVLHVGKGSLSRFNGNTSGFQQTGDVMVTEDNVGTLWNVQIQTGLSGTKLFLCDRILP